MIDFNSPALVGTFDYVSPLDDALDKDATDWEHRLKVAHETGDFAALPTRDGKHPVIFKLRIPTGRDKARLRGLIRKTQSGDEVAQETAVFDIVTMSLVSVRIGEEDIEVNGDENRIGRLYDHDKGRTMLDLATAVIKKLNPSGNS
jgi:hypothetical protein